MEPNQKYLDQKFEKFDVRFDNLHKFLAENMVTKAELQEMRSELAGKKDIDKVLTAVDDIAKQMNDHNQERPAVQQELRNIND